MIAAATTLQHRARIAHARHTEAHASLSCCRLCARQCGVNRLAGERGYCQAGVGARVFSSQVEVGDEAELRPTFAIALSGCNMHCAFCISADHSQAPDAGAPLDLDAVREQAREAMACGVKTVMIYGGEPTVHLPGALSIIACLPASARVVWKTNAYASPKAREWLGGLVDIWLADYKFGNDACAQNLAQAPNYTAVVRDYLHWASGHGRVIVRHQLMPGHVRCCWAPVASWLAGHMPGISVSLRTAFWPRSECAEHPELERTVTAEEHQLAMDIARDYRVRLIS